MESAQTGFEFVLNGEAVAVENISPQVSLLDFLRHRGLTGSKEGCAEGECGACAVILIKEGLKGTRYVPVNSCLVALPMTAGQEVLTVEALASGGELAEAQKAMAEAGGSQCGYCTPGFVVSMFAEHYRREKREPDVHRLGGNLCRCTGYRPIRDALRSLSVPPPGAHLARLEKPAPPLKPLAYETPAGRFSRPRTLDNCLQLLAHSPEARLVAGNTDLGVLTNLRGERFEHLISLEAVPELRIFRDNDDAIEIGAGLTLTEIEERWSHAPGWLGEWLELFASHLIRNRATLGGNLATASPIGDSAPLLLSLNASVKIASRSGERAVALDQFFIGYRKTLLARDEVLVSIRIPKPLPDQLRFYKVAKRSLDDISTVAAGMALWRNCEGVITEARLGFGGAGATPLLAGDSGAELRGTLGQPADFARAARSVHVGISPMDDHRGSAAYRAAMASSLIEKFGMETAEEAASK